MTTPSFQARLERAKKDGRLSTSDLSIWFGRSYHTIRGWLVPRADRARKQGYEPWGPQADAAYRSLALLEDHIRRKRGFPVPLELSPVERQIHVKRVRHGLNGRLPKTRSA
jgi:hypothetical protein